MRLERKNLCSMVQTETKAYQILPPLYTKTTGMTADGALVVVERALNRSGPVNQPPKVGVAPSFTFAGHHNGAIGGGKVISWIFPFTKVDILLLSHFNKHQGLYLVQKNPWRIFSRRPPNVTLSNCYCTSMQRR